MKRKKSLRRIMNAILSTFSNMCLLLSLNQISTCCRYSRKCCWYSTTVSCVGEKARCMMVKKPRNTRDRGMVMAVCSSVTWSLRKRENLAFNSYLYLGDWKHFAGFIRSLRKQTTFRDTTTGFHAKWRLRNERRNSILMTHHYPDMGTASDWSCSSWNVLQPIRSTSQIWVVTRHQKEFLRSFLKRLFAGKQLVPSRNVVLFSHANSFRERGFSPFIVIVFIAAGIYSQTRSSVPPKNPMNPLFESWIRC